MKRFLAPLLLLIVSCQNGFEVCPTWKEVDAPFSEADAKAFVQPPKLYYPETWFHFIDGNVDKEGITMDLEAIADAGIKGVQLFHGGVGDLWPGVQEDIKCLSPNWYGILDHTASEAQRLGLRFSMQNCPGWAMAGGPWIEPQEAMRDLFWTRTDVQGGIKISQELPLPKTGETPEDFDWQDIAVLAFPTPEGDTGAPAVPEKAACSIGGDAWMRLLSGRKASVTLPPAGNEPYRIEVLYGKPQTLRTIVFSSVQKMLHDSCYEPGIEFKVEACLEDGSAVTVLDAAAPSSNWQEDSDITFALDEATARKFIISISNRYSMTLSALRLESAARANNWEAKAAHCLRAQVYESENPVQSAAAFLQKEDIMDISACLKEDGTLEWDAPQGRWTLLRIGHANKCRENGPAPKEGRGWECNKYDPQAVQKHFESYIKKIADGPAKGKMDGMLMDSWECCSQTWTPGMEEFFAKRSGYSLRSWLPALFGYVIGDHGTTARFLCDWRECINRLYTDNFYGKMASLAKKNGLHLIFETAAGDVFPGDIMEYFKYADVPMCEFWNGFEGRPLFVSSINFKPVRPTASAAHMYGKTRVDAESFTSMALDWDESLAELKSLANHNYAQGVTHSVLHTYTHNPSTIPAAPGTSFGSAIGTPFLRNQTWWDWMPQFTDFLARLSYMLERGKPCADVLWYLGDGYMHKPNQNYHFPDGFRYDYCNRDALLNRISVKDGRLVTPEGISYSLLWLQDTHYMLPETAARLLQLAKQGAVIVGDKPMDIGTLSSDKGFAEAIARLWPDEGSFHNVGKGLVLSGMELGEALDCLAMQPDLKGPDELEWLHRSTDGADWYFIAAPQKEAFSGILDFNCTGAPSLWNPVDGSIKPIACTQNSGRTTLSLDLPLDGSCFVVFDHKAAPSAPEEPEAISELALSDGWRVSFPDGWGAPGELSLTELAPWKDLDISEEGKAFSGKVLYTIDFDFNIEGTNFVLDLGRVESAAKIILNGKTCGELWCEPYCSIITDALIQGNNHLQIEVADTWFNRLAWDAARPQESKTWTKAAPKADSPLSESGLIGPVRIKVFK